MSVSVEEGGEGVAVMVAKFAQLNIEERWSLKERAFVFCKWLGHVHLTDELPGISENT